MDIVLKRLRDVNDVILRPYEELCALSIDKKINTALFIEIHNEDLKESISSIIKLAAQNKTAVIIINYKSCMESWTALGGPYATPIVETKVCSKQGRALLAEARDWAKKFLYKEIESSLPERMMFGQFNWGGIYS